MQRSGGEHSWKYIIQYNVIYIHVMTLTPKLEIENWVKVQYI